MMTKEQTADDEAKREAAPPFDRRLVRAITFDGFGTVFEYPASKFKEAFARIAGTLTPSIDGALFWEKWLEVGRKRLGQASPEEGPQTPRVEPFRPYRQLWPEQFAATFAAVEARGDPESATAFLLSEVRSARVYAEAVPVLDAVHRRYPIALLSNADDSFLTPLEGSGLEFDAVISSEEVRSYKPEPAMFEEAARRLGVSLEHLLHVGDSPRADVGGAIRTGVQAAWLDREQAKRPDDMPEPHLHISTLDELLPALGIGLPD